MLASLKEVEEELAWIVASSNSCLPMGGGRLSLLDGICALSMADAVKKYKKPRPSLAASGSILSASSLNLTLTLPLSQSHSHSTPGLNASSSCDLMRESTTLSHSEGLSKRAKEEEEEEEDLSPHPWGRRRDPSGDVSCLSLSLLLSVVGPL